MRLYIVNFDKKHSYLFNEQNLIKQVILFDDDAKDERYKFLTFNTS